MAKKKKDRIIVNGCHTPVAEFLEYMKNNELPPIPDDASVTITIDGNAYNLLKMTMAVMAAGGKIAPTPGNAIRAMAQAIIDMENV